MKKLPQKVRFRIWDEIGLSFYFFLFFSSFVFGNLFPILSTSIQPFRFLLSSLLAVSGSSFAAILQTVSRFSNPHRQNEELSEPTAKAETLSAQMRASPAKLANMNTGPPALLSQKKSKVFFSFRDLKPENSFSSSTVNCSQAPQHPQARASFAGSAIPFDSFELPNFLSAAAAVCLYEFFSTVENFVKFRAKLEDADISNDKQEAHKKFGRKSLLIFAHSKQTSGQPALLGKIASGTKILRILRTLKIGFFLGLFVDAFKVGS